MSHLFALGDDAFRHILGWIDLPSICYLDTAVGNAVERRLWLQSLHTMDSDAVDDHEHCHLSIRWLLGRGARTTRIRITKDYQKATGKQFKDQIDDSTFVGMDAYYTQCIDSVRGGLLLNSRVPDTVDTVESGSGTSTSLSNDTLCNFDGTIVPNIGFAVVSQGYSHLASIDLSGCVFISDISMIAIAQGCPNLTSVNFSDCRYASDIGVLAIVQGCPHLMSIDISYFYHITDISVSAIAQWCPNLTSINLSYCNIKCNDYLGFATSIGLLPIPQSCPKLKFIDFSHSAHLKVDCLQAIADGCPHLTSINLSKGEYMRHAHYIFETEISAIAKGCPDLLFIDLSRCYEIKDIAVSAIARGCPHLTHLNLANCFSVTDTGLTAIAQGCSNLTYINVDNIEGELNEHIPSQ